MDFKPISTFELRCELVPNRLVLLLIKDPGKDALYDTDKESFVTIGHWFPDERDAFSGAKYPVYPGTWKAVGWDWDRCCFVENENVTPIAWAEMPEPKGNIR